VSDNPLATFAPLPDGAEQYPLEFIERNRVIKLRELDGSVDVGVAGQAGRELVDKLRIYHRKRIEVHPVEPSALSGYLGRKLGQKSLTEGGREPDRGNLPLDRIANDAPVVNLVNSICIEAIRSDASDIHVEAFSQGAVVRYRVDGVLATVLTIPPGQFQSVASRIKIMANLNILETRLPQDGRMSVDLAGTTYDFRVSIIPITRGESIVLRLLNRSSEELSLGGLGFTPDQLGLLREMLGTLHGLVVLSGPTGSGKTTTLNAMVKEIRTDALKIVTIEDPVEYVVDGVDQVQVNDQIGLTFEGVLRRVLRQDPDVIMVGEIRDLATAALAVRAALTGHLVLTTLHTNDSVEVIVRLRDMGIEPFLIASVLRACAAQRLVRRVCPACAQTRAPTAGERDIFSRHAVALTSVPEPKGCDQCRGTGYRGRTVVAEMYGGDRRFGELVAASAPHEKLLKHLHSGGYVPLFAEGLRKVAAGQTTLEELSREVDEP
jgi:general secretion pathway protein E/type IV pilus assembly protein PilB